MSLAIHSVAPSWETPFTQAYARTGAYWVGAATLVGIRDISSSSWSGSWNWTAVTIFLLASPGAIVLLAQLFRFIRQYANTRMLTHAPNLEFSSTASLAFHVIRTLLVVTELGIAFVFAKLLSQTLFGI